MLDEGGVITSAFLTLAATDRDCSLLTAPDRG